MVTNKLIQRETYEFRSDSRLPGCCVAKPRKLVKPGSAHGLIAASKAAAAALDAIKQEDLLEVEKSPESGPVEPLLLVLPFLPPLLSPENTRTFDVADALLRKVAAVCALLLILQPSK